MVGIINVDCGKEPYGACIKQIITTIEKNSIIYSSINKYKLICSTTELYLTMVHNITRLTLA